VGDYGGCTYPDKTTTSQSLNFGAGIGFEFTMGKHVGLALELPVTLMLNGGDDFAIYPIPNGSLIFYF
jgi:hypothetical protein